MEAPVSQMDFNTQGACLVPVKSRGEKKIEPIGTYQAQVFEAIAKVKTVESERKLVSAGAKKLDFDEYFSAKELTYGDVKRKNATKKVKAY